MTAQMATVSQKKVLSLILMVPLVQGTGLPVTIAVALTAPGMSRNSNEGARQSQNKDRGADADTLAVHERLLPALTGIDARPK